MSTLIESLNITTDQTKNEQSNEQQLVFTVGNIPTFEDLKSITQGASDDDIGDCLGIISAYSRGISDSHLSGEKIKVWFD